MNISEEYNNIFKDGTTLTKLIVINISVFVLILIFEAVMHLFGAGELADPIISDWLAVPASFFNLLTRPWTPITYMFLHIEFLHILFNLLWLYWMGVIFVRYIGERQLVAVYVFGGLAGAFLYFISFNIFPVFHEAREYAVALGASASVMAIIIAISVYKPDFSLNLLLIGPVKLKYIAILAVIIDIMMIKSSNAGGHIAHLGGAIFGSVYVSQLKQGKDISVGFQRFLDNIAEIFKSGKKSKMKVSYKRTAGPKTKKPVSDYDYNKNKAEIQKEIDRILDKISQSGYQSLSDEEKDLLFRQSDKI